MRINNQNKKYQKSLTGFTLMEVLIGSFLMLVVFLSIFISYQLGSKLIAQSKNRVAATSIAAGELEQIRNLDYSDVGTNESGCYPCGVLDAVKTKTMNGLDYTVETNVEYIIDPADGVSEPQDSCINDYKKAKVKVSWSGVLQGEIIMVSTITPATLAEECSETGGVLLVSVFDPFGVMVGAPLIEVKDPSTDQVITTAVPETGQHYFSLPQATYKLVISKEGFTTERTYGIGEIAAPDNPHVIVLEGGFVEKSFSIGRVSSFSIDTMSPWGTSYFFDSFADESKIAQMSNMIVLAGSAMLQNPASSGSLISATITPANLIEWADLDFQDQEPVPSEIKYQVLYNDGANWVLIPDFDLSGNSAGFGSSPVDLSGLSIISYPAIRIKALLSTLDPNNAPELNSWQVSWKNSQAVPISFAPFHLQSEETIGKDASDNFVFRYSQDLASNSAGHININNLKWGNYNFSVSPSSSLDLVGIDPAPQPVSLNPNSVLPVILYMEAENSLLLTVKDQETSDLIFSADCRLYNLAMGYDTTLQTNSSGQAYFIPLQNGDYNLEIQASGYDSYSGTVVVFGDRIKIINLTRTE